MVSFRLRHAVPLSKPHRTSHFFAALLTGIAVFASFGLLSTAHAQMPILRVKNPRFQIPRIEAAQRLEDERPQAFNQVLVKLKPGMTPKAFARDFSARFATMQKANGVVSSSPALTHIRSNDDVGWHLFSLPEGADLPTMVEALRQRPDVLSVQPNHRVRILGAPPNDTYYGVEDVDHLLAVLFGLVDVADARSFDTASWTYSWNLDQINAAAGWAFYPGKYYTPADRLALLKIKKSRIPRVAVIDTGIDLTHPDFTGLTVPANATDDQKIAANDSQTSGGQLYVGLTRYLGSGKRTSDPKQAMDQIGHGTSVAGVIAAAANNGRGIPGVGFASRLIMLRVFNDAGIADDSTLIDAITYATRNQCVAINMSLASDSTNYPQALQDAVDYAWNHGTLVIAAAGNDRTASNPQAGLTRRYPASMDHVLAVSATKYVNDQTLNYDATTFASDPLYPLASYSNYGEEIGVAAPGGDSTTFNNDAPDGQDFWNPSTNLVMIWTTSATYMTALSDPNDPEGAYAADGLYGLNYGAVPGTSFACPHVTGLAAMYCAKKGLQQQPGLPQMIINAIQRGAQQVNARPDGGYDNVFGYGVIDVEQTLRERNARNTKVGGFIGQVVFGGTVVGNVTITAQRNNTITKYTAITNPDGIYHLYNVPYGTYKVTAKVFGKVLTNTVTVVSGCDQQGVNLIYDTP